MRFLALTFVAFILMAVSSAVGQDITQEQQERLAKISSLVDKAGELFVDEDFRKSASRIRSAQKILKDLAAGANGDLLSALERDFDRISKAQSLLVDKGQEIQPLDSLAQLAAHAAEEMKTGPKEEAISFTKVIAPMIVQHCGRCHVDGNKGNLNVKDYASLIKGGRGGEVIVKGDHKQSSFYTLIESNQMPPRSNGFPKDKLAQLRKWIEQGAKFDGEDETASLKTMGQGAQAGGNRIR